jgi:hypothetical protein
MTRNGRTKIIISALAAILGTASLSWGGWVVSKIEKVDRHETDIAVLKKTVDVMAKNVRWMRDHWVCKKE